MPRLLAHITETKTGAASIPAVPHQGMRPGRLLLVDEHVHLPSENVIDDEPGMTRLLAELECSSPAAVRAIPAVPAAGTAARLALDGPMWTVTDGRSTVRLRALIALLSQEIRRSRTAWR